MQKVLEKIKFKHLVITYLLVCVAVTTQAIVQGYDKDFGTGVLYTAYNNYQIFKYSFFNLIEGKNLYIHHPELYFDLYKYSPAFSWAFGSLAWLPDSLGVFLWNALNGFSFFVAVYFLPCRPLLKKIILIYCLPELAISLQNTQSNALMLAMIMAGVIFLEKNKIGWAAFLIVACGFVKVYGGLAFLFFIFFPNKVKFLTACVFFTLLFLLLPLLVTPFSTLWWQYEQWWLMMQMDKAASTGLSFLGVLHLVIPQIDGSLFVYIIALVGLMAQWYCTLKINQHNSHWINVGLLLIWLVIFNHKAESPTYIIALAGIMLVLFHSLSMRLALLWAATAMILTSLTPGDLFPEAVHEIALKTWLLKAWPAIAVYFFGLIKLINVVRKNYRPAYSS